MIGDLWTVIYKEWKEFAVGEGRWIGISTLAAYLAVLGLIVPWQLGAGWVQAGWTVLVWAWVPYFLVTTLTADVVAGERERHTYETLLATRLPTAAIMLGKCFATAGVVAFATLLCLPLGVLSLNILLPGPALGIGAAQALGLAAVVTAAAVLGAGIGFIVSVRTDSVRQAQQVLAMSALLLFVLPAVLLKVLPTDIASDLLRRLVTTPQHTMAFTAAAVLTALALPVLATGLRDFARRRTSMS